MKYKKHIFICINQRAETAKRISCGEEIGTAIASRFKKLIKEHKIKTSVRAQRTSCFDLCEQGPIAVVYYKNLKLSDVDEIFHQHILNNKPVERLQLKFDRK